MALYEGIALIQEKQAVVLDLGTDYTNLKMCRFGFTGEAAPRCIIKSEYWCTTEKKFKRVHDYKTPEELYDNLVHMLHLLYFRHVLVNPKERKVVVVESLLTPTVFRETLAKVLFIHYEVSAVMWADSPRMCALTLGTPIALIVSLGALEAEVVAVVHGCPVLQAMQAQPLAARAITADLERRLREDNGPDVELSDDVLEDIKVRMCFVADRERAAQMASGERAEPPASQYGAARGGGGGGGGGVRVAGAARWRPAELLFHRDNELASLPDIVLHCIIMCPIDARRALAENILVTGGTAALPGLKARLADELRYLVTQSPYKERLQLPPFKFHRAPACENATAWAGGALCGAADGGARALPRDQYTRLAAPRRLRDWACLLHTTPPHHPHWADLRA